MIDYDPNNNGFSLFYITFEGSLNMKGTAETRQFKLSFMIEGKIIRDNGILND